MAIKIHFTYKTTCLSTGRFYLGMHSAHREDDGYVGSGNQLRASIKKYGKQNHICEVLAIYPDREALKLAEKALITPELLSNRLCMNIAPGGGGGRLLGFTHSEVTRQKIRDHNLNRDPAIAKKTSQTLMGRKNPEHSARQAAKFQDKSKHPKTKVLNVVAPSGDAFSFVGYEAFYAFCREKTISSQRMIKCRGSVVPFGIVKGGKVVTANTSGWSMK